MTAALDWTIPMSDDQTPPASPPLKWWETIAAPILVAVILAIGGSGLIVWREQPAASAQVATHASEIATLKGEIAALQRSQLALEADLRSNKEQMVQVREAVQEIKAFNAASMRELQNLNVQFAEIRGGLSKAEKKGK